MTDSENIPRHGSLPSHCIIAFLTRGVGTCECHQGQERCALGKLGRLLAHGEATSPPSVADTMIRGLEDGAKPSFVAVRTCAQTLTEAEYEVPRWTSLAREEVVFAEEPKPHEPKIGSATASCQEFAPEVPPRGFLARTYRHCKRP